MKSPVNSLSRILLALEVGAFFGFMFTLQQVVLAQSSPSFNCFRKTSSEYVTRLHLPSGKKYVVISWGKSLDNNIKCNKAANKLQHFFNSGRLNHIVEFKVNDKITIVCGLANEAEKCSNKNKLFELLPGDTIPMIIKRLGGSTPSDERVNDEVVIDFQKLLKNLATRSD
jgi:Circadian oscillating protein COP23